MGERGAVPFLYLRYVSKGPAVAHNPILSFDYIRIVA